MRIKELVILLIGITVTPVWTAEIYWNDRSGIHYVDTVGATHENLLYSTFETRGIAILRRTDRLFWSDVLPILGPMPGGVIRAGPRGGGMFVDLVRSLDSPAGIAVDAADEMIYWTDQGNENRPGGLFSSHFDGTEVTQLFSGPFLSEVIGLTIDEERDHLYFTFVNPLIDGLFAGGIGRVNSDGSDMRTLVTGLAKPMGIAIDANGRGLYWADRGLSIDGQKDSGTIFASDIEGRNPRTLVSGLEMPFGVALDLENRDVYWSDTATGKIQRTGMFGALPFLEDVLTDLDHPTALAIVPEPTGASLLVSASVLIALVGRRWSDGRGRDPLLGRNLVCLTTEIQPQ